VPATVAALVAVAVAAGAVAIGVAGADRADVAPLQMAQVGSSREAGTGGRPLVELTAAGPIGPYDLWLEQDGAQPVVVSSGFSVGGAGPNRFTLPAPADPGRSYRVVLRSPGSTEAVRTLVVQPGREVAP
jgi:hypothetical protein